MTAVDSRPAAPHATGRKATRAWLPGNGGAHVGAVAVLGVLVAVSPAGLESYTIYLLALIGVHTLAAYALVLLTGHGGLLNLGLSGLLAMGAYVGAYYTSEGSGLLLAIVGGGVAGLLAGLVLGVFALWLGDFAIAIVTFGLGIFVAYGAKELDSYTGGLAGTAVVGPPLGQLFYAVWSIVGLGTLLAWWLRRGWFGRSLRAMRDDPVAAAMYGLPVRRYRLLAFVVTAPFATVAGVLYGQVLGYVSPAGFGVSLSLAFIVIVILGGVTSLWGALIGSALWVMAPEWTAGITGLYFILFGAVALAVLRWAPDGLAGLFRTLIDRLISRARRRTRPSSGTKPGSPRPPVVDARRDTTP